MDAQEIGDLDFCDGDQGVIGAGIADLEDRNKPLG